MGLLKNPLTSTALGLVAGTVAAATLLCLMCPLADATDAATVTTTIDVLPSLAPISLNKTSKFISVIDRLLNRNTSANRVVNGSPNGAANGATPRPAVRPIFGLVPDVSAGVDTILNGVATGNLEQILTGSFIFSPNRVQTIANGVINRVFGGQSISSVNRPGAAASGSNAGAGAQQVAPSSSDSDTSAALAQAINEIRLQQQEQQSQLANVQQQNNVLPPSPPRQLLPAYNPPTSAPVLQQQPELTQGAVQNNSIPGQNGIGNLINSVLGGLGGIFG